MGLKHSISTQEEKEAGCVCWTFQSLDTHQEMSVTFIVSMTGTPRIVQCTACAAVCGDPGPGFFPRGECLPFPPQSMLLQGSPLQLGLAAEAPPRFLRKGGGPLDFVEY